MEEGFNGVKKREKAKLFVVAAEDWLAMKSLTHATSSMTIERHNLKTRLPRFGRQLVTDNRGIRCEHLSDGPPASRGLPQKLSISRLVPSRRSSEGNRRWSEIQIDVRVLPTRDDIGHALTLQEEERLLASCAISRSPLLHPAVVLALSSAMRYSEIRLLTWRANRFGFRCAYRWQEQDGRRH
jgi:integrase